ncbi:uncharacterized protein BO80DRAFT_461378 [Aspergillus ibericus CBS 121593]|uniref:Aminoglycoside phosphotransferase domain-containing protein n=1 Tax=Aspergillus ibericus CBS 121593 TaxID=1448316 RepID=A0A395HEJ5_9EURO|nr:hypothetical protein BO80DRAFT_461378 [Aspergillus ibericus CBS 121593]RAL05535.1 hypothetical protein BO80DRAFT_461378 [Aspergillus ibericus CBS 121593]
MVECLELVTLLCLVLQLVVCSVASNGYPLGVNLGPTYITAAYVNGDDQAIPLVKIEGPSAYQEHMKQLLADSARRAYIAGRLHIKEDDTWVPAPESALSYPSDKADLITSLLQQAQDQAAQYLHRPINITALGIPVGLDSIAEYHLKHTALEATSMQFIWHASRYLDAVRRAYGLNTCAAFGHPEGCILLNEDNCIFFVDLNCDGLVNLWVSYVADYAVDINEEQHATYNMSAYAHGEGGGQSDSQELSEFFQKFIEKKIPSSMGEDLRAVILSGEASETEMFALEQAVYHALPENWRSLLRAEIDPFYVAAIGTARRAKLQLDDPAFQREDDNLFDLGGHDEL